MPTFSYTARSATGQSVTGVIAAASVAEASRLLRAEGKYPVAISEASTTHPSEPVRSSPGVRVSRGDVIQISSQLAIMVETGVPLSDALDCIARQADKPAVRTLVCDLSEQIQQGSCFSEALARHPRSFPILYTSLIKASEKTGMLSRFVGRATAYLRDEQEILRKVKGALTYPAIMFAFALVTTIILLVFVLPRFTVIYANKKAALPLPTRYLMAASDLMVTQWPSLIGGVLTLMVAGVLTFRTRAGARLWHYIQLHTPIFGKLMCKVYLARGLRVVGTMAGAGVSLLDCVNVAQDLSHNTYFKDLWRSIADQIEAGRQLSEPLFRSPLVPRSVCQMISSGEKSGKLSAVMEQIAAFAEQELKEQITQLTRYIEPAMICVMGILIGGVSLAMLLPVFTISRVMAGR